MLSTYPHFEKFRKLTEQEEALGLLSSNNIGYRRPWQELLDSNGIRIENHEVHKASLQS